MKASRIHTALFVPASRPERIPKAVASGADAVIVDLEDTIAPEAKPQARQAVVRHLQENPHDHLWVRINDATTPWFEDDLAMCRSQPGVRGVVLPKAEHAANIRQISGAGKPLLPVIESALGLQAADQIAAVAGVVRLSFGILDLMVDLGVRPRTEASRQVLQQIRYRILLTSRIFGLAAPLDCVHSDFTDLEAFEQSAVLARDMGFGGKLCIHPAQIAVAKRVYQPQADEVEWAQRVINYADTTGEYTFRLDGRMIDLPLIERARRILEQSA